MKLILIVADAARLELLRQHLQELAVSGYTVLPVMEGAGRTGVHAGDRVHPGAVVAVMVIETAERAGPLFDELRRRCAECHDAITRFFLLPVERAA